MKINPPKSNSSTPCFLSQIFTTICNHEMWSSPSRWASSNLILAPSHIGHYKQQIVICGREVEMLRMFPTVDVVTMNATDDCSSFIYDFIASNLLFKLRHITVLTNWANTLLGHTPYILYHLSMSLRFRLLKVTGQLPWIRTPPKA